MIIADAHCDTITRIMESGENLDKNKCHVDIERMQRAGSFVQFFAAFISPEYYRKSPLERAVRIINKLYFQAGMHKNEIMLCYNYNDIERALSLKKVAAIISIEGGEALEGDISNLRKFYGMGVRSLCLTWNHSNEIADGVGDNDSDRGLTAFGREVIKVMNSLGMLVDLSHISEKSFWDVMEFTDKPVIASHSNAKKICPHKRNLTDEQILAIKSKGGVIGINLYPYFLNNSGIASVKDIIMHIEHIASLTGEDHIGLGADFDGIEYTPEGIGGVEDIHKIFDELQKLNYSRRFIEKFASGNFLRMLKLIM
ncbi:MAG TPA: membrane dipeptidase [Clostridiaceae bacterium]|nr:membrane dipeptidase [Clostridiaceae bacterium]